MWSGWLLTCAVALGADPAPETVQLLKTFREEFVAITPGQGDFPRAFRMGRDGEDSTQQPVHVVALKYSFFMAKYEVPQNLWQAVMGSNPSRWKGPRNSVEMLSYDEAEEFCRRATQLMRDAKLIEPTQTVRLPSEAEWEYCARAGTKTVYSFGDDVAKLGEYAWFTGNAAGNDPPVGAKKPNPWGLYDMHGYLWEWCSDHWVETYTEAPSDGSPRQNPALTTRRVVRSGSWKDKADRLTSSYRQGSLAATRDDAIGLRCVLTKP